uniref:Kinesin motor domain-containing protein n=1 Tax=Macrostomum lignano TaxID=282301 RepID=A0A1I8FEB0_9PLAT
MLSRTPGRKLCRINSQPCEAVEVFCRIKPPPLSTDFEDCLTVKDDRTVVLERTSAMRSTEYTFTRVFDDASKQSEVFSSAGLPLVEELVQGRNGLLFTYGVTGSGKSFTMQGHPDNPGLLPRCLDSLFNSVGSRLAKKFVIQPDRCNGFDIHSEAEAMMERQRVELERRHGGWRQLEAEAASRIRESARVPLGELEGDAFGCARLRELRGNLQQARLRPARGFRSPRPGAAGGARRPEPCVRDARRNMLVRGCYDCRLGEMVPDKSLLHVSQLCAGGPRGLRASPLRTGNGGQPPAGGVQHVNNSLLVLKRWHRGSEGRTRRAVSAGGANAATKIVRVPWSSCVNRNAEEVEETANVLKFAEMASEVQAPNTDPLHLSVIADPHVISSIVRKIPQGPSGSKVPANARRVPAGRPHDAARRRRCRRPPPSSSESAGGRQRRPHVAVRQHPAGVSVSAGLATAAAGGSLRESAVGALGAAGAASLQGRAGRALGTAAAGSGDLLEEVQRLQAVARGRRRRGCEKRLEERRDAAVWPKTGQLRTRGRKNVLSRRWSRPGEPAEEGSGLDKERAARPSSSTACTGNGEQLKLEMLGGSKFKYRMDAVPEVAASATPPPQAARRSQLNADAAAAANAGPRSSRLRCAFSPGRQRARRAPPGRSRQELPPPPSNPRSRSSRSRTGSWWWTHHAKHETTQRHLFGTFAKATDYVLTHQTADGSGGLRTEVYKGSVTPPPLVRLAAVRFNDIEMLSQISPTQLVAGDTSWLLSSAARSSTGQHSRRSRQRRKQWRPANAERLPLLATMTTDNEGCRRNAAAAAADAASGWVARCASLTSEDDEL